MHVDLATVVQKSLQDSPKVVIIDSIIDAKEWMMPYVPPIHDHLKAHQFKFQLNEDDEVMMFYKEWSSDDNWLPKDGLRFLDPDAVHSTKMTAIQPKYDKEDLPKLESTIKKITCYLDEDQKRWCPNWLVSAKSFTDARENVEITGTIVTHY